MIWSKHVAVTYARQHAHLHSTGYCARAVAAAIRAGGVKINGSGTWYSDFIQHGMYPGPRYRELKPAFKLYRHY